MSSVARAPSGPARTPASRPPSGMAPQDTNLTVAITRDSSSGGLASIR